MDNENIAEQHTYFSIMTDAQEIRIKLGYAQLEDLTPQYLANVLDSIAATLRDLPEMTFAQFKEEHKEYFA